MLGRHPTLWIALINVIVMGSATLGFRWLDNNQAGLIVVVVNAIAGAATVWAVRPLPPAVFTYAVSSVVALMAAYGLEVTPDQLAGLNSIVVAGLAFLTYGNVSPVNTLISKTTQAMGKTEVQSVPEAS